MSANEPTNIDLATAISALKTFYGRGLTKTLSAIETSLVGATPAECQPHLTNFGVNSELLSAASAIKQLAGQIHVVIHALGIMLCLEHILTEGETIEYLSLGAGNTGKEFDLETNFRVAEFKFINWRGGSESIRQNGVFKDFFFLAEHATSKKRFLYVLGTKHAVKFLNGGRALSSVLKDNPLRIAFERRYGNQYGRVNEYYASHKHLVEIIDITPFVSELASALAEIGESDL